MDYSVASRVVAHTTKCRQVLHVFIMFSHVLCVELPVHNERITYIVKSRFKSKGRRIVRASSAPASTRGAHHRQYLRLLTTLVE